MKVRNKSDTNSKPAVCNTNSSTEPHSHTSNWRNTADSTNSNTADRHSKTHSRRRNPHSTADRNSSADSLHKNLFHTHRRHTSRIHDRRDHRPNAPAERLSAADRRR